MDAGCYPGDSAHRHFAAMPYERSLYIDQWGRLRPKHSQFCEDSFEMSHWGHTCDCCGIGNTPELLRDCPDPGAGVWRFEAKRSLQNEMDIRHKKFLWLRKRFPELISRLETGNDDEIYWFYTPRNRMKYRWWLVRVVEKYGGLR
jgi:hypothetical protein